MASMEPARSGNATITQDISNPSRDPRHYADPSGATMKALVWEGKNKVAVRKFAGSRTIARFPDGLNR